MNMPSLRKRVSTYFRQLSFHHEPRQRRHNVNENAFVTQYLQGQVCLKEGPPIIYGKVPTDLPNYELGKYQTGYESIVGCYTGPNGGLTTIKRSERHLSLPDDDIDFIDTLDESVQPMPSKKSPKKVAGQPVDNAKMIIKVAGQEYCVKNNTKKHRRTQSLNSVSDFDIEIEKTKIDRDFYANNNNENVECKNGTKEEIKGQPSVRKKSIDQKRNQPRVGKIIRVQREPTQSNVKNYGLAKSKSDGNPFQNKNRVTRAKSDRFGTDEASSSTFTMDDSKLPQEWNKKSDYVFGISDSLYDLNMVNKIKNGDPIADCFGVIARKDSAILAVADGVNWGEKACIAAKSAIHGCLNYLNKTIFNDTKLFENLTSVNDPLSTPTNKPLSQINNTREVFVCLLRAFNCAHDLILEKKGMLTTLTVAVVLPLPKSAKKASDGLEDFVCCVCNVGDTLAYIYSQKYGIRELTKGSHDINSNRDMRDALGALGPVDGINPELSNLTLSITTLKKGDVVFVASDGLTDNFDPNVCRFSVIGASQNPTKTSNNHSVTETVKNPESAKDFASLENQDKKVPTSTNIPVKPPRKSKENRSSMGPSGTKNGIDKPEPIAENRQNTDEYNDMMTNPLIAHFVKQNSVDETSKTNSLKTISTKPPSGSSGTNLRRHHSSRGDKKDITSQPTKSQPQQGYSFLRSKTAIDFHSTTTKKPILRNEEGMAYVTPIQRYELQLLLMEDILKNGISGRDPPCLVSRAVCANLLKFTHSITSAKRRTLEDQDLYFDNRDGVLFEVSQQEKKIRRKKGLEKVLNLPGKLDHVTVVACNIGNCAMLT